MARYTDLDSDEARLPEGFKRAGYDADTETYTYTSGEGESYSGLPGNRYGRLYPTGSAEHQQALNESDLWATEIKQRGWLQSQEWRYLAPFLLIVGLVLISLFWFVGRDPSVHYRCAADENSITIKHGDTCWAIAKEHGLEVSQLRGPYMDRKDVSSRLDLVCENLGVGDLICLPNVS